MAFRSEREADRHRIDALEDELEEKEAEIARLRNKMAARKEPRPPEAKGRVPEVQDLPEGPLLAIPTHDPSAWKIGAIWLLTLAGVMGYLALVEGAHLRTIGLFTAIFGLPGLSLLVRTRLLLNREAGTITKEYRLLLPITFTYDATGKALLIQRRYHRPKNGDGYYLGHIFLGDRRIARAKLAEASRIARRVAAFMTLPLTERDQSSEDIDKQAKRPLQLVMVFAVVAMVLGWLLTQLKR